MKPVNTKDGRTLYIDPSAVCIADHNPEDKTAILTMVSGDVILTDEYYPELFLDLGIVSPEEAEHLG